MWLITQCRVHSCILVSIWIQTRKYYNVECLQYFVDLMMCAALVTQNSIGYLDKITKICLAVYCTYKLNEVSCGMNGCPLSCMDTSIYPYHRTAFI